MLRITIPATQETELWDEVNHEFIYVPAQKEQVLQLEHSLIALSKWESKWCKPFIEDLRPGQKSDKTDDEIIDYIRCMTVNKNVDENVYKRLSSEKIKEIMDYIYAPMTATTIKKKNGSNSNNQKVTSELIYYWMIANNIPFECERWHLNRLMMLIRVCSAYGEKPKKSSQREIAARYAEMNEANKRKFKSRG